MGKGRVIPVSGGRVIAVTTLADDGPGSLREAVTAKGPRIVVFHLSGIIRLESHLRITEPFVTIAISLSAMVLSVPARAKLPLALPSSTISCPR